MNKAVKILLVFLILFGIVSVYITFNKTVINRDYAVIEESDDTE